MTCIFGPKSWRKKWYRFGIGTVSTLIAHWHCYRCDAIFEAGAIRDRPDFIIKVSPRRRFSPSPLPTGKVCHSCRSEDSSYVKKGIFTLMRRVPNFYFLVNLTFFEGGIGSCDRAYRYHTVRKYNLNSSHSFIPRLW